MQGQLLFTKKHYFIPFKALFCVKVGAVSGADGIFSHDILGNQEFVGAETIRTGQCKRMIYGDYGRTCTYLQGFKEVLKKRKVRAFDDSNWWKWGRDYYKSVLPRIYVNTKTRQKQPFFLHSCMAYDGSVLAIFPKFPCDVQQLADVCARLNAVHWEELGFVCEGRFLFAQRSLENTLLEDSFVVYRNK